MIAQAIWNFVEEGQAHFGVVEGGIGISCFGEGDCEGAALQGFLLGLVVSKALC
jgi:hypothetical protein